MSVGLRKVSAGSLTIVVMTFECREDRDEARDWFHHRGLRTSIEVVGDAVRTILRQTSYSFFFTALVNDHEMVEVNLRWRPAL